MCDEVFVNFQVDIFDWIMKSESNQTYSINSTATHFDIHFNSIGESTMLFSKMRNDFKMLLRTSSYMVARCTNCIMCSLTWTSGVLVESLVERHWLSSQAVA